MKKFTTCEIMFDGGCDTFHPGDTIRGKVVLDISKPLSVKGIVAKFKGTAYATIFVGDYVSQKETYYNHGSLLLGLSPNQKGDELTDIPPGHHEYPFGFRLPLSVPYTFSCEGDEHGVVEHTVTASIYQPKKFSYAVEKQFNVQGILDLNFMQDANEEAWKSGDKTLSCLSVQSGVISATLSLAKKGYVPGDIIHPIATINNQSSKRVKNTRVSLMQMITMTVRGAVVVRYKKLCGCRRGPVAPGGSDQWDGESLTVPDPLVPSSLTTCNLVNVNYMVRLVVVPAGCSRKLIVPLDIIVGTVPLQVAKTSEAQDQDKGASRRESDLYDFGTRL